MKRCNHNFAKANEFIFAKGRGVKIEVEKCKNCSKSYIKPEEVERMRKELHPSLLVKIKGLFSSITSKEHNFAKGRVL
ncbi:hypothetical protein HYT57_04730 [Candidatus Woesearchaeota archaeon]|nr:hypothetical protein [Candidatus Woesearchaeota archaeon]